MFIPHYVSGVTCHVSAVTCHLSHVICHLTHVKQFFLKHLIKKIYINILFKKWTKWQSQSVEGLLPTGPTPSSLMRQYVQYIMLLSCFCSFHTAYRKNLRHTNKDHNGKLNIFSTNAAGLVNGKMESLRSEVQNMKSNLITVQETHFRKKGKFKIPNFIIFESIRAKKVVARLQLHTRI